MRQRTVDQQQPQQRENHHAAELHALRIRAADQPRRDDREHELIDHPRRMRNGVAVVGIRIRADAFEEQKLAGIADESTSRPKRQAITHNRPGDADDGHQDE